MNDSIAIIVFLLVIGLFYWGITWKPPETDKVRKLREAAKPLLILLLKNQS